VLPPTAINEGPPVTPRPSATVLLLRDGDPWELLMVQRPGGADFAPGAYVFPGGTVHERELFEEAGILLARDASEPDVASVRGLIGQGASFGDAVSRAGLTLEFDALVMFARWVTPKLLRRRFDARFYLARMPEGQSVTPQDGEVVDWRWVSPARALEDPDLTLVYATRAVLESVASASGAEELLARARAMTEVPVVEPRLVQTGAGWEVVRD
jgi:8-oxo-dGTP pyrophosphatase MutT (NUDIX family)